MTSRIGQRDTDADVELRACLDQNPLRSFVMVAGAGSGKTTSLVKALAHLQMARGQELRRKSQQIACITYTDVAVREIWGDVGNAALFHVSTIHSFLWSVLSPFTKEIREWARGNIDQKIEEANERIAKPRTQQKTRERLTSDIERYNLQKGTIGNVERFVYGTGSDLEKGILGHDDILKIGVHLITTFPLMRTLIANRFPFVFVDESQDTTPEVVEALKLIAVEKVGSFCLGFFGDPMQKIYLTGAGRIDPAEGWAEINKPENFRCPTTVLNVVNLIRAPADGLEQTRGRHKRVGETEVPVEGAAHMFVLAADETRSERLLQVQGWMSEHTNDPAWRPDTPESDVRLLVLVHRMAANRLGFPGLYSALNDHGAHGLKDGLLDGTAWILKPMLSFVLPLIGAVNEGRAFDAMNILRRLSPRLEADSILGKDVVPELAALHDDVQQLVGFFAAGQNASIRDVYLFLRNRNLLTLDERIVSHLDQAPVAVGPEDDGEDASAQAALATQAHEVIGFQTYIRSESPFNTQQGVKGAEFERVLVVLDDEEASYNLFSNGKYFGFTELSDRDRENLDEGKDSVVDRTRRLFYVSCSRATDSLAVVVFAPDTAAAKAAISEKGLFPEQNIHTEEVLG